MDLLGGEEGLQLVPSPPTTIGTGASPTRMAASVGAVCVSADAITGVPTHRGICWEVETNRRTRSGLLRPRRTAGFVCQRSLTDSERHEEELMIQRRGGDAASLVSWDLWHKEAEARLSAAATCGAALPQQTRRKKEGQRDDFQASRRFEVGPRMRADRDEEVEEATQGRRRRGPEER